MKNIFKRNHIIITALAIMIAIAGYINFTSNDKPDKGHIQTVSPDLENFNVLEGLDGTTLVQNDVGAGENAEDEAEAEADDADINDEVGTTAVEEDVDENDEILQTAPVEDDADELGDLSDEDLLAASDKVKGNAELDIKENGVPGEAVLVTSINASFFSSAKLAREQTRARNKATLMDIIENTNVSDSQKQDALNSMLELNAIAEKENATELLLEAKGFDGAVVSIVDGKVDVVVNASSITDQQAAIIEDVVKRKTSAKAGDIVITPVVVSE